MATDDTIPFGKELIEGEDFYFNEQGYKVFTEKYHLKRGYCCQNGCKHCPYGFNDKKGRGPTGKQPKE